MTPTDGEKVLAGLVLDPTTRQLCSPRYDELLLAATFNAESLVTLVYKAPKSGDVRVIQLGFESARWGITSEHSVATISAHRVAPPRLEYAEREFHFVPGSGEAPTWVDAERPRRTASTADPRDP